MPDVFQVARINPQPMLAVPVALATLAPIAGLLAELAPRYYSTTQTGDAYPDRLRLTITREGYPDQFAYPGDWLVITDAEFIDKTGVWTVSDLTEVKVWGQTASAGTPADFAEIFEAPTKTAAFDKIANANSQAQRDREQAVRDAEQAIHDEQLRPELEVTKPPRQPEPDFDALTKDVIAKGGDATNG